MYTSITPFSIIQTAPTAIYCTGHIDAQNRPSCRSVIPPSFFVLILKLPMTGKVVDEDASRCICSTAIGPTPVPFVSICFSGAGGTLSINHSIVSEGCAWFYIDFVSLLFGSTEGWTNHPHHKDEWGCGNCRLFGFMTMTTVGWGIGDMYDPIPPLNHVTHI